MALLQISEPDRVKLSFGIDLGTTNSLVAHCVHSKITLLSDSNGSCLIPSVVHYAAHNTLVGEPAKQLLGSDSTIGSVKRSIGSGKQFTNKHSAVSITADILSHLKAIITRHYTATDFAVVITVPAYFHDAQRQETLAAAKLANLEVMRLLNEPTAAAMAYGLDLADGLLLVYDLGGGTFDISLVQVRDKVCQVLAVNGDTKLGGDDFDKLLLDYILVDKLNITLSLDSATQIQLLQQMRRLKEQLSDVEALSDSFIIHHISYHFEILRSEFEALINPLLQRTLTLISQALHDANITIQQIQEIILVGGSTRIPFVQHAISAFFKRAALCSLNPDEVVAMGASIYAEQLLTKHEWLLLDVTPLSLAVETMGGIAEVIIPRNSILPVTASQEFTTYCDNQTTMMIHVVQGEAQLVEHCVSLAKFILHDIPALPAASAIIDITYQLDVNNILSVSATERSSGVKSQIEIQPYQHQH